MQVPPDEADFHEVLVLSEELEPREVHQLLAGSWGEGVRGAAGARPRELETQRPNVNVTRPTAVIVTDGRPGSLRVLARLLLSFTGLPAASVFTGAGN